MLWLENIFLNYIDFVFKNIFFSVKYIASEHLGQSYLIGGPQVTSEPHVASFRPTTEFLNIFLHLNDKYFGQSGRHVIYQTYDRTIHLSLPASDFINIRKEFKKKDRLNFKFKV